MPREVEPPNSQRDFLLSALKEGVRIDGRSPLVAREARFLFGEDLGWVECSLGKTRVVAYTSATIVRPFQDRPFEGILVIHSEISPMASSVYETGRSSDDEVTITRMLEKTLRRSEALDREALCILAGEKVWSIRITLHFLSDEGNLLDCACLAAVTSLKHFRKPDVEVIGQDITIHSPEERAPVSLAMHHMPLCVTFAFFGSSDVFVVDPSHLEEQLATGTMSVSLNAQREICVLQKAGGAPLHADEVMRAVNIAVQRVRLLSDVVNLVLEADTKTRIIEVR